MPTQARKPCSGCARSRRMISTGGRGIAPDRIGLPPQAPVARRHGLAHRMGLMVPSLFGNFLMSWIAYSFNTQK
jgi:hypothetical protein